MWVMLAWRKGDAVKMKPFVLPFKCGFSSVYVWWGAVYGDDSASPLGSRFFTKASCLQVVVSSFRPRFPFPEVPLPDVSLCTYSDILISLRE